MARFVLLAAVIAGSVAAAPVPQGVPARVLVAGLSDPSDKVRDASSTALRGRADAPPWLRRASRSADADTARRTAALLAAAETARQEFVPKAIDACIRGGRADLFVEWHHYWKPQNPEWLWPVGARMGKAAITEYGKIMPSGESNWLEHELAVHREQSKPDRYLDGPQVYDNANGVWHVRAALLDSPFRAYAFASVAGPIFHSSHLQGGYFYSLGPTYTGKIEGAVMVCDGPKLIHYSQSRKPRVNFGQGLGSSVHNGFVACRGSVRAWKLTNSVLLVDGDVYLSDPGEVKNSLIRASGEVRLQPERKRPLNSTIEAHAKNATAPYRFFELADAGLNVADDEEGMVVTAVTPDTPFGDCGLAAGDLIRAIDDAPAGHSEEFRKLVRRALVRQGDGLITVTRGDKTLDIPVFFPLPK